MPTSPTASSSARNSSATSSSILSPNHPVNLRKQARATLDPAFSVRSYLGAAATLLEKAESSDRQGHLEQAFVNYLKAANVASFISKHPEWPNVQAQRGPTYFRYQDFMQKITDVISRAKRIEETLEQREERSAALQAQRHASESHAAAANPSDRAPGSSAGLPASSSLPNAAVPGQPPPPPAEPGPSKELRTHAPAQGDAASVLLNSTIRAPPDQQESDGASGSATPVTGSRPARHSVDQGSELDQVASLADRLSALRSGGLGAVAMGKRFSEPVSPTGAVIGAGDTPPEKAQDPAVDAAVPTASQFAQSYPSLDEFDRSVPSPDKLPSAPTMDPRPYPGEDDADSGLFPAPPSHAPGQTESGKRRPLPNPPSMPTDLALGRDVPKPFDYYTAPKTSASSPTAVASPTKPRPQSQRPPSSLIPGGSPLSPKLAKSRPVAPIPGSEPIGPKPSLPRGNHIKVEELWSLLNPGFERVAAGDEASETRMVRKRGLDILLLDLRSREEFDTARVGMGTAAEAVCLEGGVILRRGMTSADLEDKLLLSPPVEQNSFANRNKFDAVVLYDRCSRLLGQPNPSGYNAVAHGWTTYEDAARAWEHLDIVVKAIYEHEFTKTLNNAPYLLVGGWDSWTRKVGAGAGANPASNGDTRGSRSGSVTAGGTPVGSPQMNEDEFLKRQRRQGFILPDDRSAATSQYRARSPLPQSYSSGLGGGGFTGGAMGGFAGVPMPAKAYQSPGTPSANGAPPAGAPAFPPSAARGTNADGFFPSQPSIPYGGAPHPPPPAPVRQMSATFDYPRLKSANHPSPKPPPAAMASNGVSTRSMTSHAHNQSLSSTRGASLDISRRPQSGPNPSLGAAGSRMNVRMIPAFDDLRIGLTGLKNVGNSCYQNATLQCLSATIPLAKFMLDGSYKKAINKVNPLGTQGALAESFAHLIKVMWSEQYTFVSPVTFRDAIGRFQSTFKGFDQHDSQEFLAFLLDGLHEDLNYVMHKPAPVDMTPEREHELETLPQQVASVKEWTIYRQRNDSLIVDWFQGQFRNKMTCLTCGKTSTTYNAFMYLSLPIPATGRGINRVTLFQCLDAFVREEVMDKADAWYCPSCKKPRKATKRLSISRLPMILLIHLKRFSFKGPFTDKIETHVTFPLQGLDLTNYVPAPLPPALAKSYAAQGIPLSRSQNPPYVYDLYATTHHFGSLNTGHYTASIKSAGQWWYCDDSRTVAPPPGPPSASANGGANGYANGGAAAHMSEGEKRIHSNSPYVLWFRRRPHP